MRYLLLLVLLNTSVFAQQQRPVFQSYTTEDGLGGEAINDLLVDQYGYVWSAAYSGLHRFDGYEFIDYPADILNGCRLSHPIATTLLEDSTGSLWVGTRGGLNRLDRSTNCFQRFFHVPSDASSLPNNDIYDLAQTADGLLYVATAKVLASFNASTNQFLEVPTKVTSRKLLTDSLKLFVAGSEGLQLLHRPQQEVISFPPGETLQVFDLLIAGDSLLIATNRGVYYWQPGATTLLPALPSDHPFYAASIQQLLLTKDDLWLATRGNGLGRVQRVTNGFTQYLTEGNRSENELLDNHTRALATDDHGSLWIGGYSGLNRFDLSPMAPRMYSQQNQTGQEPQLLELGTDLRGGVYYYERLRGLFRSEELGQPGQQLDFPANEFLIAKDLNHIYTDRNGITWLLRGKDRLYRFNPASGSFLPPISLPTFTDRRLNNIAQDPALDHIYWLASSHGLGRLDIRAPSVEWFLPGPEVGKFSGTVLTVVLPARDGKIWLSCGDYYNDRLGYFNPSTQRFTFLNYIAGDPDAVAGGRVKQLAAHPDGSIWAAASQGIIRINPAVDSVQLITRVGDASVGIPEAILIDGRGNVWFSTGDQLGRYLPTTERLSLITCSGVRQFSNAAAAKLTDNRLLFAGLGGIVAVRSDQPLLAGNFPRIVFNAISTNGQTVSSIVPDTKALPLKLGARNLSLYFAGLYFDRTRHIEYAFRINKGPWQQLGQNRSLTFTDLQPGEHDLEIRASDGQANWNPFPRRLSILVPHYWHETSLARWVFLLLTIGLLSFLGRLFLQRKLERQAHEQLLALDAFKSRLFTDLTHEFRTPLTLILGPARRLRERASLQGDGTLGREARRIDRQGRRLLNLINQLLDLRKLEAGQLKVERSATLLTPFFRALTESFRPEAEQRKITLQFRAESTLLPDQAVATDRTKQESIFQNLLSNALKFTPEGGSVDVILEVTAVYWSLQVTDTGCGIPAEQKEWIFQRFARAHGAEIGGSGIGLSFVQDLTRLLDGSISLASEVNKGTTFHLRFPTTLTSTAPDPATVTLLPETEELPVETSPEDAPLVLIVEDEEDVAAYLEESLRGQYRVMVARNGQIGLEVAFREIPDLVVSDVMMPQLNGLQLCARLKADRRTSHLPVLLLTARSAEEHRLEGLDRGADAYLSKPFSERELHLRLRNLLVLRDRMAANLRENFMANAPTETAVMAPGEAGWLTDLRTYITERLDDPELSGEDLERHVGMSRSQLQRKLQSVLGLSPRKLVNEVRLETAARRLRETPASVSEVAYDCGFRDPKYFGRVFRERFGRTPGSWREGDELGA